MVAALQQQPPTTLDLPILAAAWRAGFFKEIHRRFELGEPTEDIDITHRRVLDQLLDEAGISFAIWGEDVRQRLVDSWHHQTGEAPYAFRGPKSASTKLYAAWPDAIAGIELLKRDYFVCVPIPPDQVVTLDSDEHLISVVLANGTTRLQLDIVKSTGLPFHSLFSSQLLSLTKVGALPMISSGI